MEGITSNLVEVLCSRWDWRCIIYHMSEIYHLYLDESETKDFTGKNRVFCIAGLIIKERDYPSFSDKVKLLKRDVWIDLNNPEDIVMHEKDIRFANNRSNKRRLGEIKSEFHRFKENAKMRDLYEKLNNIIETTPISIIGACIKLDGLSEYFHRDLLSDKYLIAMQILFENFCQFLQKKNGVGYVFYESRKEENDKEVRMRFNHIKAMGSMYISPYAMQKHLIEINFPSKLDNNEGLQVADFIPNNFAREHGVNDRYKFNIFNSLRKTRYDGGLLKHDRFGIKVMP